MQKRRRVIIIVAIIVILVIGALLVFSGVIKPRGARLVVESEPMALVLINGEQVGRTPFERDFDSKEVDVKLIPQVSGSPLAPYETKVRLESGIKTVIRRNFGATPDQSSGEVISFDKSGSNEASISIVSTPDGAQIKFDGQTQGVTPQKIANVAVGNHTLEISAPGFSSRSFSVKAEAGYRLTVIVQLSGTGETQVLPVATAAPEEEKSEKEVEILNTPTGFLRVRSQASTSGQEIGQVSPGKKYKLIEKDQTSGWLKIEYEEGKQGWVSSQYAKEVE